MKPKTKRNPYMLPDEDCERLRRTEMMAVRMLLAALSTASYAQDDLGDRLECIPNGAVRMRLSLGGLRAVADDIIGTISKAQAKQIWNTLKDFEMRVVPKLTPQSTNVILSRDEAKELIDCARWKCHSCVEDGTSCRKCRLYQLLEATTPLDDYGDQVVCPYALTDWE